MHCAQFIFKLYASYLLKFKTDINAIYTEMFSIDPYPTYIRFLRNNNNTGLQIMGLYLLLANERPFPE